MNSILKIKCTKDQDTSSEKLYYTKARNKKNTIKGLQEVMTFLEKHDYDKTCMDSKRKKHKYMIGTIKKTTIKPKISLKNRKINNKNYRALELKVQHNSKLNKNKPKL